MKRPRGRVAVRTRLASLALALAAAGMLAGCLVIPVDYYSAGSRSNLNTKTGSKLQPGVTTKEDVFLLLGEPDQVSEDGQRLGYAWSKVKAIWIVASYGGGAGGEAEKSYLLLISFDASNRVSRASLVKQWGSEVMPERARRRGLDVDGGGP